MNVADNYDQNHKTTTKTTTVLTLRSHPGKSKVILTMVMIVKFGTEPITPELLQKVKTMTGEIHPL